MIFLNPQNITLDGQPLDRVRAITISRRADRLVVEHSDAGPHPTFVDAPEQRTTITLVRDLTTGDPGVNATLNPGRQASLAFTTAPNASDADARSFSATVVITAAEVDLRRDGSATQTLRTLAVSTTGASDPFSIT